MEKRSGQFFLGGGGVVVRCRGFIKEKSPDFRFLEVGISDTVKPPISSTFLGPLTTYPKIFEGKHFMYIAFSGNKCSTLPWAPFGVHLGCLHFYKHKIINRVDDAVLKS